MEQPICETDPLWSLRTRRPAMIASVGSRHPEVGPERSNLFWEGANYLIKLPRPLLKCRKPGEWCHVIRCSGPR